MNYFRCGGGRTIHTATKIDVAKTPLATFQSNVSGLYLPEILAYFSATQSGTGDPSPSNIRPINGVSEVTTVCNAINQWDEQWEGGSISQADGTNTPASNQMRAKNYIVVLPNANYYIKSPNITELRFYDANKTFVGYLNNKQNSVVTIPNGVHFMRFVCVATTYNNDISINYPSTDTAYHAYTGTTATINLGGTYYGGYLNVQTGVLTVTHSIVDLGTIASFSYDSVSKRWQSTIKGLYSFPSRNGNLVAEKYVADITTSAGDENKMFTVGGAVYIYYTDSTTPPSGNLVYPLATPVNYQLTPAQIEQLLGQNNVFCSSGDVAVKYWKID